MMTKTDSTRPVQDDLFRVMLCDLVAKDHELVLLSDAIDWKRFEKALEPAYSSDKGRPSVPVRMMAGLTFLKYMFAMSDQDVLDNWCENPYWHYFCGVKPQHAYCDLGYSSVWPRRILRIGI